MKDWSQSFIHKGKKPEGIPPGQRITTLPVAEHGPHLLPNLTIKPASTSTTIPVEWSITLSVADGHLIQIVEANTIQYHDGYWYFIKEGNIIAYFSERQVLSMIRLWHNIDVSEF